MYIVQHRIYSIQISHYLSPMLRFVYYNIKLYNFRERRVHVTEASPIGFVQNVHCFCERFEVIMYNHVSRCFEPTGSDYSVCIILSDVQSLDCSTVYGWI